MENWKCVAGFEGLYDVSDQGNVFSLPKIVNVGKSGGVTKRGGFNLRQNKMKSGGHLRVYLADGSGKKKPLLVHRLVAAAFLPNPEFLPVVHHKDGNPENNRVDNIEWCTVGQNTCHSIATGLRRIGDGKGEKNSFSKLTDDQVRSMRKRFAECGNSAQVAREFSVSLRHSWNICHRRLWRHLE